MPAFGLNIEVDVDVASVKDLGATAFEWFDEVSRSALKEPRAAAESGAAAPVAPPFVDPTSWNPAGDPVQLRSMVQVTSRRAKSYTSTALEWLRERLAEGQTRADLHFWLTAGSEPDSPNVWYPSLYAHRPEPSPGWMRLGAYVQESAFVDPHHGPQVQQLWLKVLRSFVERLNPGFGQIEYGYDDFGATGLEFSLSPDMPLEEREPDYTLAQCRQYLRGYSWLTVVPGELAERLGGAAALQNSGAFVDVAQLDAGGVWLLATEDYRDYGPEQIERVFRVLRPVLRPGLPEHMDDLYGDPPQRLVFEDAADSQRA